MRYTIILFMLLIGHSCWSQRKDTLVIPGIADPASIIVISQCTQKKTGLTHIDSALNRPKPVPANTPIRIVCARRIGKEPEPPLFVVDGIMTTDISKLPLVPADVESIEVLKTGKQVAKYGDAGRNGVIIITTKSKTIRESVIKNLIDSCQSKMYPELKGL